MVVRRHAVPEGSSAKKKDDDLYHDLDRQRRRWRFGCLGCVGLLLFLLLGTIGLVGGVVAASGWARIPILSDFVYRTPPQPVRTVAPAETSFDGLLEEILVHRVNTIDGRVVAEVTEAELTAALREPNQEGRVLLKDGQVAIDDEVEIYGLVSPPGRTTPMVLRVQLSPADSGGLRVSGVRIGYVPLPAGIAHSFLKGLTGIDLESANDLNRYGLTSIGVAPGVLQLSLSAEFYQQFFAEAELGELLGEPTLAGVTLSDIASLTAAQRRTLEDSLSSLPAPLAALIEAELAR